MTSGRRRVSDCQASPGDDGPAPRPARGTDCRTGRAGAIVVLGCRVLPWGGLTAAAEGRVAAAAEAYRTGAAPRIVTSGGRRWGAQIEAIVLRNALVARGVPASAIEAELWSMTTYENAVFSAALLRRLGASAAVVVTCSWHVRRALRSFRFAGIEATAWPHEAGAGALDRLAETARGVIDARLLRRATALSRGADAFLRPLPPGPT